MRKQFNGSKKKNVFKILQIMIVLLYKKVSTYILKNMWEFDEISIVLKCKHINNYCFFLFIYKVNVLMCKDD